MAILAKKVYIQKGSNSAVACNIYSTTTEAGSTYFPVITSDGTTGYVALGATSHGKATSGRVTKSSTTYAILSAATTPYTKKTYTSAGTHTFTVPTGVTKLKVTVAGAGGGAGTSGYGKTGGKGGTGGLSVSTITVTPNTTYSITVGAGGAARTAGGSSKFGSITATGGKGGTDAYDGGGYYYYYTDSENNSHEAYVGYYTSNGSNGANGTPAGAGGAGGSPSAGKGGNGWVYVEYGEGIQ